MSTEHADAFREALRSSKHIVVIAGAGLSAASGIPTYHDGGGLWRTLDATALASPEAFRDNPSLVWQFYHYRRNKALEAKPNAAHEVVAKMSVPQCLKQVAPDAQSFHLITQNIDRLSTVALQDVLKNLTSDSPSSGQAAKPRPAVYKNTILEMHGRLFDVQCTQCNYCVEDRSTPLTAALGAADADLRTYQDAGTKTIDIPEEQLPRCAKCRALARPGVVWFNERPLYLDEINNIMFKADMCLVIGTSSQVRPASTYAYRVRRRGGKVALFNLDPSEKDIASADFVFKGPCETLLPAVLPELH
ncbi:DHS-like NAD/FAD-binding domain-containing protein [Cubamyces sp. BRFM 1775]|nr:DHS-like NAD/FAD-binding domain-containing protein [Cubamyces sp. BRFM 1775]